MAVTLNPEDLVTLLQDGIAGIDLTSPSKDNTEVLTVLAQSITDYLKPTLEGLDTDGTINQELSAIKQDIVTNTNSITTNTNNITTNANNITTNANNITTNANNITTNSNNNTLTAGNVVKLFGEALPTEFNITTSYAVDDKVEYNNNLYRCTNAHAAGVWVSSNFKRIDLVTVNTKEVYIEARSDAIIIGD